MKQYDEKDIEEILQNHSINPFDALQYGNKDIYTAPNGAYLSFLFDRTESR